MGRRSWRKDVWYVRQQLKHIYLFSITLKATYSNSVNHISIYLRDSASGCYGQLNVLCQNFTPWTLTGKMIGEQILSRTWGVTSLFHLKCAMGIQSIEKTGFGLTFYWKDRISGNGATFTVLQGNNVMHPNTLLFLVERKTDEVIWADAAELWKQTKRNFTPLALIVLIDEWLNKQMSEH